MAKTLFLGGAFFIGRSYQWRKTSLIRNVFCVWAIGLSEARGRWRRGWGCKAKRGVRTGALLKDKLLPKKIEARKGSRASHKEGDYGVFTPFLRMSRQAKEGKPSCLHLLV